MTIMGSKRYDIVSGAQLPTFVGRTVSLVGVVTKNGAAGSSSFTLNTSDNISVNAVLNKPLERDINGEYIEVRGTCENSRDGRVVKTEEYFIFSTKNFDAKSHTALCKLINSIPNITNNS